VLAGALKDSGRATIAGSTTYGKGLIQTIAELSDGSGLAVTVARYQTPLGIDINKVRTCRQRGATLWGDPRQRVGSRTGRVAACARPCALPVCPRLPQTPSAHPSPQPTPNLICPLRHPQPQVGISPDIPLEEAAGADAAPGQLPPPTGDGVCRLLASPDAPRLFKK
jgi:hypothetical protein